MVKTVAGPWVPTA